MEVEACGRAGVVHGHDAVRAPRGRLTRGAAADVVEGHVMGV